MVTQAGPWENHPKLAHGPSQFWRNRSRGGGRRNINQSKNNYLRPRPLWRRLVWRLLLLGGQGRRLGVWHCRYSAASYGTIPQSVRNRIRGASSLMRLFSFTGCSGGAIAPRRYFEHSSPARAIPAKWTTAGALPHDSRAQLHRAQQNRAPRHCRAEFPAPGDID